MERQIQFNSLADVASSHLSWQRLAVTVALWSFAYAAYRAYYALGDMGENFTLRVH